MHINELQDELRNVLTRQEELLDKPHGDGNPALTGEEVTEFDKLEGRAGELEKEIEKVSKLNQRKASVPASVEAIKPEGAKSEDPAVRDAAYAQVFDNYLRFGVDRMDAEQRTLLNKGRAERAIGDAPLTVTTTAGGYLIPTGFQAELQAALKEYGGMRKVARILNTPSGNPIEWPTMDDTANTGELLAINTTVAELPTAYGHKTLLAYKYSSKIVLVPMELAQDSFFDMGSHLRDVLSTRIGRITNTHFTVGSNSGQPQGVVGATPGAYSSVTSEGATGVTYNDLVNLEHSVDPAYRRPGACNFMFADSTLKVVKKLKDADGNPIWRSGLASGSPADILGWSFVINQDVPAATTGLKSVVFGDFSYYIIRDVLDITLLRLVERYAEVGQVGYIAFSRHDGRAVSGEANNGALRYLLQA